MILLTIMWELTQFVSVYLLVMPVQYVVMSYFTSSTAFFIMLQVEKLLVFIFNKVFIIFLQVVMYWKSAHNIKPNRQHDIKIDMTDQSLNNGETQVNYNIYVKVSVLIKYIGTVFLGCCYIEVIKTTFAIS